VDLLLKLYQNEENRSIGDKIYRLINDYITNTHFNKLAVLLLSLNNEELGLFIDNLLSESIHFENIECAVISSHWPSFRQLLIMNSLLPTYRPRVMRNFLQNLPQKKTLLRHLVDHHFTLITDSERITDNMSHFNTRNMLLSNHHNQHNHHNNCNYWSFILFEAFLLHFRLSCCNTLKDSVEILLGRESIPYEPIYEEEAEGMGEYCTEKEKKKGI